jgi:hypothetical protein
MTSSDKLKELRSSFPKLTEENQQYMLGMTEGLKHAQTILKNTEIKTALRWEKEKQSS